MSLLIFFRNLITSPAPVATRFIFLATGQAGSFLARSQDLSFTCDVQQLTFYAE